MGFSIRKKGSRHPLWVSYQNAYTLAGWSRFGYRFIDDSHVECLSDGVRYGDICTYSIKWQLRHHPHFMQYEQLPDHGR